MKTIKIFKVVITTLLLSTSLISKGQTIEQLQKNIQKAEQEIKLNTTLLESSKRDENVTIGQLKITRSSIEKRRSIIKSLDKQVDVINSNIKSENKKISNLNSEITTLKSEYSDMIVTAYKNYKLNNYLLFLFASKDFNDATKRIAYMKRYNNMREAKAVKIEELRLEVKSNITSLNKKHISLSKTTDSKERELKTLNKDEGKYRSDVKLHQSKQISISRKLKDKEKLITQAQKKIEQIVAEEIRKNKNVDRSVEENKYIVELSGRFDQNIGKLPYPVRGGVIVDKFGIHSHLTSKGLKVNNKGVNIAGKSGATVYSVFEGVVAKITFFQGQNNCIFLIHGNYITVYSNLSSVTVKEGQKVKFNQPLGNLSNSSNSDEWNLHFEIWKATTPLNPENCLRR